MNKFEKTFFTNLASANEENKKAKANKVAVIATFMKPIEEVCNALQEIWPNEASIIKVEMAKISQKYGFQYRVHHELSEHSLVSKIEDCFPLKNYGGDYIDNLDDISYAWEFTFKSTPDFLIVEINPIDPDARYPVDPDENPEQFTYRMPVSIHQKFVDGSADRIEALREYVAQEVGRELEILDQRIKKQTEVVQTNIKGIDFTNPQVREALAAKLKEF